MWSQDFYSSKKKEVHVLVFDRELNHTGGFEIGVGEQFTLDLGMEVKPTTKEIIMITTRNFYDTFITQHIPDAPYTISQSLEIDFPNKQRTYSYGFATYMTPDEKELIVGTKISQGNDYYESPRNLVLFWLDLDTFHIKKEKTLILKENLMGGGGWCYSLFFAKESMFMKALNYDNGTAYHQFIAIRLDETDNWQAGLYFSEDYVIELPHTPPAITPVPFSFTQRTTTSLVDDSPSTQPHDLLTNRTLDLIIEEGPEYFETHIVKPRSRSNLWIEVSTTMVCPECLYKSKIEGFSNGLIVSDLKIKFTHQSMLAFGNYTVPTLIQRGKFEKGRNITIQVTCGVTNCEECDVVGECTRCSVNSGPLCDIIEVVSNPAGTLANRENSKSASLLSQFILIASNLVKARIDPSFWSVMHVIQMGQCLLLFPSNHMEGLVQYLNEDANLIDVKSLFSPFTFNLEPVTDYD